MQVGAQGIRACCTHMHVSNSLLTPHSLGRKSCCHGVERAACLEPRDLFVFVVAVEEGAGKGAVNGRQKDIWHDNICTPV
jgi:hypothetical protein